MTGEGVDAGWLMCLHAVSQPEFDQSVVGIVGSNSINGNSSALQQFDKCVMHTRASLMVLHAGWCWMLFLLQVCCCVQGQGAAADPVTSCSAAANRQPQGAATGGCFCLRRQTMMETSCTAQQPTAAVLCALAAARPAGRGRLASGSALVSTHRQAGNARTDDGICNHGLRSQHI